MPHKYFFADCSCCFRAWLTLVRRSGCGKRSLSFTGVLFCELLYLRFQHYIRLLNKRPRLWPCLLFGSFNHSLSQQLSSLLCRFHERQEYYGKKKKKKEKNNQIGQIKLAVTGAIISLLTI